MFLVVVFEILAHVCLFLSVGMWIPRMQILLSIAGLPVPQTGLNPININWLTATGGNYIFWLNIRVR